jgi:HSP20 family protein
MAFESDLSVYRSVQAGGSDDMIVHVERLWSQVLSGRLQQPQYNPTAVRPAVDVYQTRTWLVIVMEAPGMRDQELRLAFEPGRLTISGEKRGRSCVEQGEFHQLEIACGAFSRTVELPVPVDPDGIQLSYDDGYIEIRLPRVAQRREQMVRITLHQS